MHENTNDPFPFDRMDCIVGYLCVNHRFCVSLSKGYQMTDYQKETQWLKGHHALMKISPMGQFTYNKNDHSITMVIIHGKYGYPGYSVYVRMPVRKS